MYIAIRPSLKSFVGSSQHQLDDRKPLTSVLCLHAALLALSNHDPLTPHCINCFTVKADAIAVRNYSMDRSASLAQPVSTFGYSYCWYHLMCTATRFQSPTHHSLPTVHAILAHSRLDLGIAPTSLSRNFWLPSCNRKLRQVGRCPEWGEAQR